MVEPVVSPTTASIWGAPVVSVYALTIFLASIGVAAWLKYETVLIVLLTAAATNATNVVGYWIGSSAGSQKKDETIAAQSAAASKTAPTT